jgi:hypothetical protein
VFHNFNPQQWHKIRIKNAENTHFSSLLLSFFDAFKGDPPRIQFVCDISLGFCNSCRLILELCTSENSASRSKTKPATNRNSRNLHKTAKAEKMNIGEGRFIEWSAVAVMVLCQFGWLHFRTIGKMAKGK